MLNGKFSAANFRPQGNQETIESEQASLFNNTIFGLARHPWKIPVSNPI
jgi:hypothetical protein